VWKRIVNAWDWIASFAIAIFSSKARARAQEEMDSMTPKPKKKNEERPTQPKLPEPLKSAIVVSCRKENRVIEHTCYTLKELAAYVTNMRERGFKITERSVDDQVVAGDNEDTGEKRDGDSEVTA